MDKQSCVDSFDVLRARGWSCATLARALGLSPPAVSQWSRGVHLIPAKHAPALRALLDAPVPPRYRPTKLDRTEGAGVVTALLRAGWTQAALSRALGVARSTVHSWATGRGHVPRAHLIRLAALAELRLSTT